LLREGQQAGGEHGSIPGHRLVRQLWDRDNLGTDCDRQKPLLLPGVPGWLSLRLPRFNDDRGRWANPIGIVDDQAHHTLLLGLGVEHYVINSCPTCRVGIVPGGKLLYINQGA